jgi:choline dehydrogenase-like flavoprotein
VCQLRPESRGFVRIKSPDPAAPPAIQPRYLSTETDRRTNVEGLKREMPAMRPYVLAEHLPGSGVQSDDELLAYCRESAARSIIQAARAAWERIPAPWSIRGSGCTASRACASSTGGHAERGFG